MKVFVAGATGVLGRATVRELVAAGHEVRGMARNAAKARLVSSLGAEPVEIDLFDPLGLHRAIAGSEAVLHLATRIPPLARMRARRSWRENDRLRREGSERLMNATIAAGAKAYVQEAVTFAYADGGDAWLYETAPLAPIEALESVLDAERETARITEGGGRGVVLRFAAFYSADAVSTQDTIRLARRRLFPIIGDGARYFSSIHVDDAARAVVAALDAPAGIYNVCDDEPLHFADYVRAVTDTFGFGAPFTVPRGLARFMLGFGADALLRSQRVANKLYKSVTGWSPRYASARDGWRVIASQSTGAAA